jgi:peptidoglycan/LPS O-acetylase OafA/YrhL
MWAQRDPRWSRQLVNYLVGALIWNFVMPMNTAAHLGGFFAGAALAALLEQERRPERRRALAGALGALCVVASVGSVVLAARSPVWKAQRQLELARDQEVDRMRH